MLFYLSIAFAIISTALYHVFQKSISPTIDPLISMIVTYLTSLFMIAIILPFYPLRSGFMTSFKEANWASFALAFGVVGIELGYLLVYRSGWKLSLAAPVANASLALILLPIGLLFFHETLSLIKIVGLALCIGGVILINI